MTTPRSRNPSSAIADESCIRVATGNDVVHVLAIARAAYAKYVARIGREPAPMAADYVAAVAMHHAVVVEIAGNVRGYMIAWPEGDAYFIENIGVNPQSQGIGLGRQLIGHAVAEARRLGFGRTLIFGAKTKGLLASAEVGQRSTSCRQFH